MSTFNIREGSFPDLVRSLQPSHCSAAAADKNTDWDIAAINTNTITILKYVMQSYGDVTNDSILSFVLGLVIIEMSHHSCRSENSTEAKVLPHFPSYFVPYCHVSWILTSM